MTEKFPQRKNDRDSRTPVRRNTSTRQRQLRRKRTVKAALDYFESEMPGRFKGRAAAIERIRKHKRPLQEAKRSIAWLRTRDLDDTADELDFSDVQLVRARIIRRDGILDRPQAMLLARMDRAIAIGAITRRAFAALASAAIGMKPALSASHRKAEAEACEITGLNPRIKQARFTGPTDLRSKFPDAAPPEDAIWDAPDPLEEPKDSRSLPKVA